MQENKITNLDENLNLDKKTLVFLRYIAILGQFATINLVYFYLELQFNILASHAIIFFGLMFKYFFTDKDKTKFIKRSLFCDSSYLRYIAVKHFVVFYRRYYKSVFSVADCACYSFLNIFKHGYYNYFSFYNNIVTGYINVFTPSFTQGSQDYLFKFPSFYLAGILISILIGLFF